MEASIRNGTHRFKSAGLLATGLLGKWTADGCGPESLPFVMDEEFWSTIPLIDGIAQACQMLQDAGFTLVCVSAIESKFQPARVNNLRDLGIPMPVIATGRDGDRLRYIVDFHF